MSWPEIMRLALGDTVDFYNNAQPGHTMTGPSGSLAEVQAEVLDFLDPDAEFTIVFNGHGANDFYGAFQRTAEQHRDNCNLWADEVQAADPTARLLLCGVFQYGGSTAEERAEVDAWNAMIADLDNFATNFPRYLPYPLLVGTIIPEAATTHPPFEVDNTHLDDSGELRVYEGAHGAEGAEKVFWRAGLTGLIDMGTLSSYARTALVSHARNKGSYSPAANHYCAAFVAGVEVSGNGYARATLANNKTTWGDAAARAITNDVPFEFPDATASWGTIDEIRIYDASSGGNELARHTLAASVPISDSTGPLFIDVGAIDITFAAGGFTNTVVHELLDLMFGATANAPRATVYGTYFNGDPQGAGAETSAARTAITQATAWNAAVAGLAKTAAAIALADEADATHYAEYTAAAAGTLLFSAALPASFTPPVGGSIPAGGLRTSLT
jgi:hypothetical protein